jgi:hypothetical protein
MHPCRIILPNSPTPHPPIIPSFHPSRLVQLMIVIIGAGISGLTAARNLDKDYIVLEKENYIGGLSTQYPANS